VTSNGTSRDEEHARGTSISGFRQQTQPGEAKVEKKQAKRKRQKREIWQVREARAGNPGHAKRKRKRKGDQKNKPISTGNVDMEPLQIASLEQRSPLFFGAAYQYPKKTSPARNICLPIERETEKKKSDKQGSFHRSCFEAHVNQATRRATVHPRNRIQPDPKQKN
jgi:hypothetical protein